MKTHNLIVNTIFFAIISSFRVIPPLLVTISRDNTGNIPVFSADWLLLFSTLLWLFFMAFVAVPFLHEEKPSAMFGTGAFVVTRWLWCIPALAALTAFNQLWQYVAEQCGKTAPVPIPSEAGSAFLTPFLVLFLAASAFSEEVLYRRYLPDAFSAFLSSCSPSSTTHAWTRVLSDVISMVIFALSHRYLGWTAAANAFCAAGIFTLLTRKNGSIIYGGIVHFSYNLILCLCM